MTTPIMRGPTKLRAYISEFLAAAMPDVIVIARDQWGLDGYSLPEPKMYDAVDPSLVGNDQYPALGAVVLNDRNHIRQDWDSWAQQTYATTYSVRIFVAARTPQTADGSWELETKASAIRLRDDLTRLLQHVLLQTPSMNRPDEIRAEETSMQTDYLEPMMTNTQSKRWVAPSIVTIEVSFTESTVTTPIGTANTFIVTVEKED